MFKQELGRVKSVVFQSIKGRVLKIGCVSKHKREGIVRAGSEQGEINSMRIEDHGGRLQQIFYRFILIASYLPLVAASSFSLR